ncbi:hypothetical protein KP509_28G038200 [Ceratopteris richardii]|uniref:C3H1-type domain-containing protein n=1 Tax=Ceratopteris richardii TaxID=49495 RepID=A0A8T2RCY8_CERRI|nr:hypothetical protein KP509_28G038200 [Ceratopteris richardii]
MNAASGYGANTQNYHVPRNHYYFKYYSLTMSENSTYPERPGQPQCKYFIRTGNCKFGAYCKYDHPKRKIFASANCSINPMGFPQRPGTEPCTFDMQYGACKFGVACRFDHPCNSFTYSLSHNPIINFPVFCVPQLYGSQKSGPPAIIDAITDQQIGQDENSSNNRRPLLNVTTPEIVASGIITAKEPKSNSAN